MTVSDKFFISYEAADLITSENLLEVYNDLSHENVTSAQMEIIPDYKVEEMVYNNNMLRALKVVLDYYGVKV